ncbi:MAG: sulfite exporter TauE/SafE family protein [Candidatus Levybacteria bacterium]|nr:sulfite exporter TauE/SafE family protein [Candidatus Levybacteria bacterium]
MDLWVIFITGLTVGGLTCLAVQGGLLASVIAAKEEEEIERGINRKNTIFPTLAFLLAKLVSYSILGFILGAFGGAIGISQQAQIIMQFAAGIYMVAVAFNLLEVHPVFRYAVIQPPKFLTRRVRNQSKSKDLFAPIFLGAMTIFIPCGTTLAMEALAISSANAFLGAAIMAAFVLGTMPLFFGIGWITSILGDNFREKFLKIAAIAVLYLGITSANGALVAGGSPISIQSVTEDVLIVFGANPAQNNNTQISQNAEIIITPQGYSPNYIKVRKGSPVTIKLIGKDAYSCASAFRIPQLGISKNLQPNETQTITFTPQKTGPIPFSCSMGMYRGVIEVI